MPFSPGAGTDLTARTLAQKLNEKWGQQVVADNRTGAGGAIGVDFAAKAIPDGYTICLISASNSVNSATNSTLPYNLEKDLQGITQATSLFYVLYIHPSIPAKSVKELVALVKKNPGKFNYSSSGTGGNNHFSGALFASAAGIKLTHIPYKGISQAMTALASGEVELVIASAAAVNPQLKAGRVRALGVTSLEPSALLPGLPAIAQSGVPGYSYELWWGLFAPAGLPAERMNFINAAVNKSLASPEMKKFLDNESAEAWVATEPQIADLLPKEIERYRKAAKEAGIKEQ